jgi:hypothetical protein
VEPVAFGVGRFEPFQPLIVGPLFGIVRRQWGIRVFKWLHKPTVLGMALQPFIDL